MILLFGDAFVCASERQRDHWLGALAGLGRVTPEAYADDPALDGLVGVVPFGLDVVADPADAAVVKGVLPGIAASDRLLLWGGGIWDWFDPLTVIRATGALDERRGDVRLLFLGLAHPSTAVSARSMAERAQALAVELGLEGRSVFFNRGWVPYGQSAAPGSPRQTSASARISTLWSPGSRTARGCWTTSPRARRSSSRAATSSPTSSRHAASGAPSIPATSRAG